jgi:hypothetical protein
MSTNDPELAQVAGERRLGNPLAGLLEKPAQLLLTGYLV